MKVRLALIGFAACALIAALALIASPRLDAQSTPDRTWDDFTAEENEALTAYQENELITARRLSEEVLDEDNRSLIGHYVLGAVLRESEGNHARAMRHFARARELYENTWPTAADGPWRVHRDVLYAIQGLAGEMGQHEYRLEILEYYDALYDPDLTAQHAWPLMQLGEFDDARDYARLAIDNEDPWQQQLGHNAMCAVDGLARERTTQFNSCVAAFEHAQLRETANPSIDPENATNVAVHAYNAGQGALSDLRFDQAEQIVGEGAARLAFTPANPYRFLVKLYTLQGRMQEAVNALFDMRRWQSRQPVQFRDQDRAQTDAVFATVLLVAGETEIGVEAITRALDYPDRRGLYSTTPEQALGGHALLRRAMVRAHEETLAEERAITDERGALFGFVGAIGEASTDWGDRERIRNVLIDSNTLRATFRPYLQGGLQDVPTWLIGELVDAVGPGVVAVALDQAREEEGDERFDAYFDAFEVDVAYARSQWRECVDLAADASVELPITEVLLRARVLTLGAECARRHGDDGQWLEYLDLAMQDDPGTIRRLGFSIPASIEVSGDDDLAELVLERLEDSPRFDVRGAGGFEIDVRVDTRSARACIYSASGGEITCGDIERPEDGSSTESEDVEPRESDEDADDAPDPANDDEDWAEMVLREAHRTFFAMPLGVSTLDLQSLDGRVTLETDLTREDVRNALEGVLQTETW